MACIRNSGDTILNSNEIEGVDLRIKYRVPRIFAKRQKIACRVEDPAKGGISRIPQQAGRLIGPPLKHRRVLGITDDFFGSVVDLFKWYWCSHRLVPTTAQFFGARSDKKLQAASRIPPKAGFRGSRGKRDG